MGAKSALTDPAMRRWWHKIAVGLLWLGLIVGYQVWAIQSGIGPTEAARRVAPQSRLGRRLAGDGLDRHATMAQLRARPSFAVTTRPARSSTARCRITVGSRSPLGRAKSDTAAGPCANRSTIARRVGSASA